MTIKRPLLGKLNQGVIFSCARAEDYSSCNVFGLVLTARCDIAQDKYPVLNYMPVVSLDDWLKVDGFQILLSRVTSEVEGRLYSALSNANISKSLLFSQTPRTISKEIFGAPDADKRLKAVAGKFEEIVTKLENLEMIRATSDQDICNLFEENIGISKGIIKELAQNRLSGYYFIPSVTADDEERRGYVVLMRHVLHLPRSLAKLIASGLDRDHSSLDDNPNWMAQLNFAYDPFSMPIGEIPSPMIEHIMQSFASLFGRIGLEDLSETYLNEIQARKPQRTQVMS